MASFSFRTCKKVEESSEGGGEGGREGEPHNGARTPYIGLPDGGGRRPDAADGQRKQKPEWRTTGGCWADTTRREENGEAGTAADKGTAEHSNPSIEIGTMIFVVIVIFSSVGYENRQFGLSEPR